MPNLTSVLKQKSIYMGQPCIEPVINFTIKTKYDIICRPNTTDFYEACRMSTLNTLNSFLDVNINKLKRTNQIEHQEAQKLSTNLSAAYSEARDFIFSLAFIVHLIKLITNIILFALILASCLLTVVPFLNPTLEEVQHGKDITLSFKLRTLAWEQLKLTLTNAFNMVLSAVSPVIRTIRSVGGFEEENTYHNSNSYSNVTLNKSF